MTAMGILNLTNQASSCPVCLRLVCKTLGVCVAPHDGLTEAAREIGEDIISAYAINGEKVAIFYDSSIKDYTSTVRFEVAKQLAHFLKFKKETHFGNFGMCDEIYDFVAELLIPKDALRCVINRLIMPEIQSLARIFDVPDNLVRYRLSKLGIKDDIVGYNASEIDFYMKWWLLFS